MTDYKRFKLERLDPISSTFCAAKWLCSDFYLHTGTTSSCHFPTPDKINFDEVESNIHKFNNTSEKIEQRRLMLEGKQPDKCSNCWQVENSDPTMITERVIYSEHFKNDDFTQLTLSADQKPKVVTVSFDTICNFVCSYCDASQSTAWGTDLLVNGFYKSIKGDPKNTYVRLGKNNQIDNYDQVFSKFVEYIIAILSDLRILICLGGEPLISPNFWKFLDILVQHDVSKIELNITTNLSDVDKVQKFLEYKKYFGHVKINVSVDNAGKSGEFLRKGLSWDRFSQNLGIVLKEAQVDLLATIPGIALDNLIEFLDWFVAVKENDLPVRLFLHRVRHPNFQTIQVLPREIRENYRKNLLSWLDINSDNISDHLRSQINNIIVVLEQDEKKIDNVEISVLQSSAREYYKQYAQRHGFDMQQIFSKELNEWIFNEE